MTHEEFLAEQKDIMDNWSCGFISGSEMHNQLIELNVRMLKSASFEYLHNN